MELDQIVASLDQRMKMLRDEIATLEAARAALGGSVSRAPQRPARVPSGHRSQRRRRHASVTTEQLELLLAGAGEVTTTVLIEQTGASRPALLFALKELETSGKVRRAGEKRGTRWSAVSGGAAPGSDQGAARGDWAGPSGDWEASSLD
jgi:predicted Rossmann fold nucleotide-binding protein DprA/Smf involved in DNA uptake